MPLFGLCVSLCITIMALSDRQIRNAEPKEKRYSLTDGGRSLSRNLAKRRQMVAFSLFHQWHKICTQSRGISGDVTQKSQVAA